MLKLNPFAKKKTELVQAAEAKRHANRAAILKAKRSKDGRKGKAARSTGYRALQKGLTDAYEAAEDLIEAETKAGNYQPGETDEEGDE